MLCSLISFIMIFTCIGTGDTTFAIAAGLFAIASGLETRNDYTKKRDREEL